ncbi:MAG: hypothetical protein ACRD1G_00180, partial [Acidimicrobiales bacterium]
METPEVAILAERRRAPEHRRPGLTLWVGLVVGATTLLVAGLPPGPLGHHFWVSPVGLFWIVTVGAGLCWLGGLLVLRAGWRDGLAEVALLGTAIMVGSIIALVHGLAAPGVLYGSTNVLSTSALIANPLAMCAAFPLIGPRLRISIWTARHVRPWAVAWVIASTALASLLVILPDGVPAAAGATI